MYLRCYEEENLNRVSFPMGGIGAGMLCLDGTGSLSHLSVNGEPEVFNEPLMFGAVCIKDKQRNISKVLEGPVPGWKIMFPWGKDKMESGGGGGRFKSYGLPRFSKALFYSKFPFGHIDLKDDDIPLDVKICGWSPFIPGKEDLSSLPFAGLEYTFKNNSDMELETVFSFHALNFMKENEKNSSFVDYIEDGFILSREKESDSGKFCITTDSQDASVNYAWFRGEWFDGLTQVWNSVQKGEIIASDPVEEVQSPGGSLYVPLTLKSGEEKTVRIRLCWYVSETNAEAGCRDNGLNCSCKADNTDCTETYSPWYSSSFKNILETFDYWKTNYQNLHKETLKFTECFYNTSLPDEIIEAVSANLSILKSPTLLRQTDGRLWCWEGCCDCEGCCHGSCTHVWNYAQAIAHLFPNLERSLRDTEFNENQDEKGHQDFRANLPISLTSHDFYAAADGQLGGIMKIYRDWKISGNKEWLREIWPKVKSSLNYCIETWDPKHKGIIEEPHHNTYDIEFWGPNGMTTSFYLGALKAASLIAEYLKEDASLYLDLFEKGRSYMETELWNGEYFIQKIQWKGLKAGDPTDTLNATVKYSPEAEELLKKEGPKYQYGNGCLSDGILGVWMAYVCGIGGIVDEGKVQKHLKSVYKYNFRKSLKNHANPQRPTYALGNEGGLLLCSWPKGDALSLPFVYSNEVWTGIEYQVAAHLITGGQMREALDIIKTCRKRYDGENRNPYNEFECGHWYARALSSYGLLQCVTGARYDAVTKTLYVEPNIEGDFHSFFSAAGGYGTVGVKNGKPFYEKKYGNIEVQNIKYIKK
jgi:uncharacterized protein (DUF608 family)